MKRRDFLKGSLLLGGYALMGCPFARAGAVRDSEVKSLKLVITNTVEFIKPPKKKGIGIWVPIPCNDQEQEHPPVAVESGIPHRITEDTRWGNRMAFFETETVSEGEKIILRYEVQRKTSAVIIDKDEDPKKHLIPSEWEKWDENIAKHVDSLVGDEKDPVEIGRKVYHSIIGMMEYIHEVCGRGVSLITFEDRLGRCDEFNALFRSMMMYKGIPVKWEQGMSLPYPSEMQKRGEFEADCINARSWLQMYIGNDKWMPVDVTEGKRRSHLREFYYGNLVPNRIKFSTGRGLTLNPPQRNIINTFPYTYVEAGGFPAIYGHNYRNRMRYELRSIET